MKKFAHYRLVHGQLRKTWHDKTIAQERAEKDKAAANSVKREPTNAAPLAVA